MIILSFMQWLFVAYVIKEIFEGQKDKLRKLSYDVAYFVINNYSKAQIIYNKWNKKQIKSSYLPHAISIDFCKNGEIVKSIVLDKEFKDVKTEHIQCDIANYDFAVVTDDLHGEKNKICINEKSDDVNKVEKSNIKFLSFSIHYKNKCYDLKLCNDKENFYTVKNRINKNFLKFQLKQMGVDVCEEFPYKMSIIDHDVNIIELDNNDEIVIEKDTYEIKKSNNSVEVDEKENQTKEDSEAEDEFVKIENVTRSENNIFHPGYVI